MLKHLLRSYSRRKCDTSMSIGPIRESSSDARDIIRCRWD